MRTALSNLKYFDLRDARGGETFKGGDQDWYGSWWRRMSGCGPTTATNVILYLRNSRADGSAETGGPAAGPAEAENPAETGNPAEVENPRVPDAECAAGAGIRDKAEFIRLMDHMWQYVTPGHGGVNTTSKLRRGVAGYACAAGLPLRTEALDIPDARADRPTLAEAVAFIRAGLKRDLPVAFLNLDNGAEIQLEKWHWVTITGLVCAEDGGAARVDILDNCDLISVDLGRWLSSAARGGGFVRFLL
jgi:hypothetical protein